ncbi:hypothetical protein [Brevundimonas sp. DC300-4]|uniref:hypothetical protein n=1 Tax=Brevundimonas sp. DC300-4 TaxID=2804594 RepID=UPI003CF5DB1B
MNATERAATAAADTAASEEALKALGSQIWASHEAGAYPTGLPPQLARTLNLAQAFGWTPPPLPMPGAE